MAGSTKKFELITAQEIEDVVKENSALKNQDDVDEIFISSVANYFHPLVVFKSLFNKFCINLKYWYLYTITSISRFIPYK